MASKSVPLLEQSMLNSLLAVFDDEEFMKKMVGTHVPGGKEVDVQSLFALAKNTLDGATTAVVEILLNAKGPSQAPSGNVVFTPPKPEFNPPLSAISEVGYQITRKALDTKNVKETMEAIFHELSGYSWVVKSVITLSAMALYYADFWHLAQIQASGIWAESMAILKGIPTVIKSPKKGVFIELNDMIRTTLEMTQCIVDFEHDSKDVREPSNSIDIARCVYKIIISVLACSIQFASLISLVDESNGRDLPTFASKVKTIYLSIKKQFEHFKEKKAEISEYNKIRGLFNAPTVNVELIKAIFLIMHGPQRAFFLGSKDTTMDDMLKSLRRKNVLLLFSNLNLATEDLKILVKIYSECKFQEKQYEILWIPILEQEVAEDLETHFGLLRGQMSWYSVHYKAVSQIAIRIIKEKWYFKQENTVVVLDPQGKVVNQHAMHDIRTFESAAFPFTREKAANLWTRRDISCFILLVTGIIPGIKDAMDKEECIFLYDRGDTKAMNEIEGCLKKIVEGGVPITHYNMSKFQLFRSRLESFIISKSQTSADPHDPLMQDILKLYTNYKEAGGYVVLAKGSIVVIIGKLAIATKVWSKYEDWKAQANAEGLDRAFKKQYDSEEANENGTQCHHFYFPNTVGCIPEDVKCPSCARTMRSVIKYECCHGAH